MKLTDAVIEQVSSHIVGALIERKMITLKAQRGTVKERIKKVIKDEREQEELLDKEVARLIDKNKSVLGTDMIDYNRMFTMVKTKLAKEKGIVL